MEPRKLPYGRNTYENRTYLGRVHRDHVLGRADQFRADPQKKERLEASECVVCFTGYGSGRAGGAMCTTVLCCFCEKEIHFGSTCIDIACVDCAKKHGICKHCGGDVNLKHRRKLSF